LAASLALLQPCRSARSLHSLRGLLGKSIPHGTDELQVIATYRIPFRYSVLLCCSSNSMYQLQPELFAAGYFAISNVQIHLSPLAMLRQPL